MDRFSFAADLSSFVEPILIVLLAVRAVYFDWIRKRHDIHDDALDFDAVRIIPEGGSQTLHIRAIGGDPLNTALGGYEKLTARLIKASRSAHRSIIQMESVRDATLINGRIRRLLGDLVAAEFIRQMTQGVCEEERVFFALTNGGILKQGDRARTMRVTFITERELLQLVREPQCGLACDDDIYRRRKAALDQMVETYLSWKAGTLPAEQLFGNLMLPKGLEQRF